jgi:ribosomal protein L37AE/L43A
MTLKKIFGCHKCDKEIDESQAILRPIWKLGQHKIRNIYYCPMCRSRIYVKRYEGAARKRWKKLRI